MVKALRNLKGACEDLSRCAIEFEDVIPYLKQDEGSLKVVNDEFAANVEWLEMVLKFPQLEF